MRLIELVKNVGWEIIGFCFDHFPRPIYIAGKK